MPTEAQILATLAANGTLIHSENFDSGSVLGLPPPGFNGWSFSGNVDTKVLAGRGTNGTPGLRAIVRRLASDPGDVSPEGLRCDRSIPNVAPVVDWGPIHFRCYVKFLGPNENNSPPHRFYCRRTTNGVTVTGGNNGEMQKFWYVPFDGETQGPFRVLLGVNAVGPNVTGENLQNDLEGQFGFDYAGHITQGYQRANGGAQVPAGEPDVLIRLTSGKWFVVEVAVQYNIGGNQAANRVRVWVNGTRVLTRENFNDTTWIAQGKPRFGGGSSLTQMADTHGGQTQGDPNGSINPPTDLVQWRDNVIIATEFIGAATDLEPADIFGGAGGSQDSIFKRVRVTREIVTVPERRSHIHLRFRPRAYHTLPDLWITQAEIDMLPTSGPYWDRLLLGSTQTQTPKLQHKTNNADVYALARALVYRRTGSTSVRDQAVTELLQVLSTLTLDEEDDAGIGSRALAPSRNLVSWIIAAQLLDLTPTQQSTFTNWLVTATTTVFEDGRSIRSTHRDRPNNWGTMAGASRIARALYLGDQAELDDAVKVFRGYLGDRSQYAGFNYGGLCWQSNQLLPVGINPLGATISGFNVDGVLPDDQRRWDGSSDENHCVFQANPFPITNYVYEALHGAIVQAVLLYRAGYTDAFLWSDQAIGRAYDWLYEQAFYPAAGDDLYQVPLLDFYTGTNRWRASGSPVVASGKNMGWTDWTHGLRLPSEDLVLLFYNASRVFA